MPAAECSVPSCDRPQRGRKHGLCHAHLQRLRLGRLDPDRPIRLPMSSICQAADCSNKAHSLGLCYKHYYRFQTHGSVDLPQREVKRSQWVTRFSYRVHYLPDHPMSNSAGAVYEHRLVMAQTIGRNLARFESVHHVNGDRLDNRPENLELWSTSQPAGQRVDDKIAWALELLELYRPDLLSDHVRTTTDVCSSANPSSALHMKEICE